MSVTDSKLFSVVIPIYKVEKYLSQSIESIINQSIGFKNNINIILVNDGSPDGCKSVCLEYQSKYPDNIIYIEQANSGVSAARNNGMQYANGKYISFLDSDDKWAHDAFEKVSVFFNANYDETDVVCCPMTRFDGADNKHKLHCVFDKGSRIADIKTDEEKYTLHVHVTSCIFKREAIGDTRFQPGMKYGEDTLFVESMALKKGCLGLCADAVHYYRRRSDNSSAIQTQRISKEYYMSIPHQFYGGMINESNRLYGKVLPYIQSCIAYDIGWRLSVPLGNELSGIERQAYFNMLSDILQNVDDKIILKSPFHRKLSTKMAIINTKYKKDCYKDFYIEDDKILFNSCKISGISKNTGILLISDIRIYENKLSVTGKYCNWVGKAFSDSVFTVNYNDLNVKPMLMPDNYKTDKSIYGESQRFSCFDTEFDVCGDSCARFILSTGNESYVLGINYLDTVEINQNDKYDVELNRTSIILKGKEQPQAQGKDKKFKGFFGKIRGNKSKI